MKTLNSHELRKVRGLSRQAILDPKDLENVAVAAAHLLAKNTPIKLAVGERNYQLVDCSWDPDNHNLSLLLADEAGEIWWRSLHWHDDRSSIMQVILDKREEQLADAWNARQEDADERGRQYRQAFS